MIAGTLGAKQRLVNAAEVEHLHPIKAIKLWAPQTAIISLPLLAYAMGRVSGRAELVPSILELSSAASHNLAILARHDGTILPAVQSSAIVGLLFVLPDCTANLHVFTRHHYLPQKHALHRQIGEFKSWMGPPIMPSRPGKNSASRTVDCVLEDCFFTLGCMYHHLGGIPSAVGDRQVLCVYCFPIRSSAVHRAQDVGATTQCIASTHVAR